MTREGDEGRGRGEEVEEGGEGRGDERAEGGVGVSSLTVECSKGD